MLSARFTDKILKTDTDWLWTSDISTSGYGRFWLNGEAKSVHVMSWEDVAGPVPDGFQILHTCDIRHCIRNDEPGTYEVNGITRLRWGHLWCGTPTDNTQDMIVKGRRGRPAKPKKWRDIEVKIVRVLFDTGNYTYQELSEFSGIPKSTIGAICQRNRRKE